MCVLLAGCLAFDALAQASNAQMPTNNVLDLGNLVRFLGGILLAFIAYWTRGIEKRVEATEHEQKQLQTQITLLREQMLRDYMTKHEIEKLTHEMKRATDGINSRLDFLISPTHRRRHDEASDASYLDRG